MPNDELLTDEYVAGLLAKDAQDCSLKFSTMGMDAYGSSKKPANHPKPNTRFLRNIIKNTDSHNTALLAKEAAESQARLERLEKAEGRRNAKPGDIRKRQIGSINAILGNKPSRGPTEESSSARGSRRDAKSDSRRRSRSPDEGRERARYRDRRDEERSKHRSDGRASHARKRHRHDESPEEGHHRSRQDSSRRRSRSPSHRERRHRERSTSRHKHEKPRRGSGRRRDQKKENEKPSNASDRNNSASDSDPLDDFIGPAPPPKSPVRTRGRGAISAFSGIDRRFAADYDPKLDVEGEGEAEADNWSEAVEAFRDRQKLRAAQEERLRAAGFSEEAMGKLRESGRERTEADVKWAKAGEKREWDIGKKLGAD